MVLEVDSNEPVQMGPLLTAVEVEVGPLNAHGFADYRWWTGLGERKQVERKTWGELVGRLDEVEEQLHRHLTNNPDVELVFLLEGLAVGSATGTTVMKQTAKGIWVKGHSRPDRLKGIYAWLYEVGKYCEVVCTASLFESAAALQAMYEADQKEEHRTFHRHIKTTDFHPDPQVMALMNIAGPDAKIGEKRAFDLIARFTTAWNVLSAGFCEHSPVASVSQLSTVRGIGDQTVRTLLSRIGRPDI